MIHKILTYIFFEGMEQDVSVEGEYVHGNFKIARVLMIDDDDDVRDITNDISPEAVDKILTVAAEDFKEVLEAYNNSGF
jgi:hypothetical protein